MKYAGNDTLKTRKTLDVSGKTYTYYSLPEAAQAAGLGDLDRLPFSMRVLLENLVRLENGRTVSVDDIKAVGQWLIDKTSMREIAFRPARVLMQDFTGVPAVCDLAAMRQAMVDLGGNPKDINPLSPVDLVIDHSVIVDSYGSGHAFDDNVKLEFERNGERYSFLRWGSQAFDNFRVVPPGTGICHQVNLEYLSQVVWKGTEDDGEVVIYPDTLVGTDSHTTMINGLAVLGWGVGGIEAEAAMLGQPISMLLPEVVGMKLTGKVKEGTTTTDLVLTVTQMLRKHGVVGRFVEFYGPGLDSLAVADRATLANMAPEYGATCGFFPVDQQTINFLNFTGRSDVVPLVEAYYKAQGMWRDAASPDPVFTSVLELDLGSVEPSLAGPSRPQDRVLLSQAASSFQSVLPKLAGLATAPARSVPVKGTDFVLSDGDVVIAAITSCTNTSNPSVLMAAGLLARNAVAKGLKAKPWVKTSLAPGSQVVTDYLDAADLTKDLNALGFNLVGYGCTTCIGNSGPLSDAIGDAIEEGSLIVGSVLSGNRNFEGRVSQQARASYLASPPLVVAYAIAGSLNVDLLTQPLGQGSDGQDVYLKDIWPSSQEIDATIRANLSAQSFISRYSDVFKGTADWQKVQTVSSMTYKWVDGSTYIAEPPFFKDMSKEAAPLTDFTGARILALLGDSITTDHISPAGSIKKASPAGSFLLGYQVRPEDFNQYGTRRGNHEVMMRGTFANVRIKNEMVPGIEGGITKHLPDGEVMPIYDAAMKYVEAGVPSVIIAGKEYGTGSSRDWAAKGTRLLGVKAVLVESFERIHRSNLAGMGVVPLEFKDGMTRKSLKLDGTETIDITGLKDGIKPGMDVAMVIHRADGSSQEITVKCRIDTLDEVEYYRHGGILQYVLRNMLKAA